MKKLNKITASESDTIVQDYIALYGDIVPRAVYKITEALDDLESLPGPDTIEGYDYDADLEEIWLDIYSAKSQLKNILKYLYMK